MVRYPESAVWEEIAYLAYHLHWSLGDLLELPHRDRTRMIGLVSRMDQRSRVSADG